jgi:hypothetical protein
VSRQSGVVPVDGVILRHGRLQIIQHCCRKQPRLMSSRSCMGGNTATERGGFHTGSGDCSYSGHYALRRASHAPRKSGASRIDLGEARQSLENGLGKLGPIGIRVSSLEPSGKIEAFRTQCLR